MTSHCENEEIAYVQNSAVWTTILSIVSSNRTIAYELREDKCLTVDLRLFVCVIVAAVGTI